MTLAAVLTARVGCLLKDEQLSEPFALLPGRELNTPSDGQLWLRCDDAWNSLSDNRGTLKISITKKSP